MKVCQRRLNVADIVLPELRSTAVIFISEFPKTFSISTHLPSSEGSSNSMFALPKKLTEVLKKQEAEEVNTLLLVGGFSDCLLIREAINNAFCDKTIIMPEEAGLSVLKGAVLFGHRPDYVQSRVIFIVSTLMRILSPRR
jgi:hypothetical protein